MTEGPLEPPVEEVPDYNPWDFDYEWEGMDDDENPTDDPRVDNRDFQTVMYDDAAIGFLQAFANDTPYFYEAVVTPERVVFKMVEWEQQENGTMAGRFWTRTKERGDYINGEPA